MSKNNITKFFSVSKLKPEISAKIPLASDYVKAGFPSPADDFIEDTIDLNRVLVKHPYATFFVKVDGDSMIDANIFEGDILVVDRALEPQNNDIVIAVVNGEFTLKRLIIENNQILLKPENINYKPILITENDDFYVWGVVSAVIRQLKR